MVTNLFSVHWKIESFLVGRPRNEIKISIETFTFRNPRIIFVISKLKEIIVVDCIWAIQSSIDQVWW